MAPQRSPSVGTAFLLSQVGAHAAGIFEGQLATVGLTPYHAGLLRMLGAHPGLSQKELSDLFGVFPSRLVALIDRLEEWRLVQRRAHPTDRRSHRLFLTDAGREKLGEIGRLTVDLESRLCVALDESERRTLHDLLSRIVAEQRITPAVHPAYRRLRDPEVRATSAPPEVSRGGQRTAPTGARTRKGARR